MNPSSGRDAVLAIVGLSAAYGRHMALHAVNLRLDRGESVALLGPNGSGKTTLLNCIAGLVPACRGEIRLYGQPLLSMTPRQRARLVCSVPQCAECPAEFTVMDFVLLGRYPHLSWLGLYGAEDHEAARQALEEVGALELAGRMLSEISGGETQRVLLARALAQTQGAAHPLLLLDELAAGLDLARLIELFERLELHRRQGACLCMVMHDCNLAALFATRLVGLKEGRVLFDGPVREVFTEERLHALYDIAVRVFPHPVLGVPQALPLHPCGVVSAPPRHGDAGVVSGPCLHGNAAQGGDWPGAQCDG